MSDYDSGSSSDSSSDGGWSSSQGTSSSSGDASSQGGLDFSPLIQSLLENLTEPGRPETVTESGPSQAERKRQAQFEETLRGIFFAEGTASDSRGPIRRIVEAECWYVPTEPDGSPFRAYLDDPGEPARQLSGRALARAIPADADGALLVLNAETSVMLRRADLPQLVRLADSLDLEEMLIGPAPGQLAALRAARWYVPHANQQLEPTEPGWGSPTISLFTHPDRAGENKPMVELDGQTLCDRLAGRDDYVGLHVNGLSGVGTGAQATQGFCLAPSFARGIARGVDPRPGAAPLVARTLAEMMLWLDLDGFPWKERTIVPVEPSEAAERGYVAPPGSVLLRIQSPEASDWRIYETSYGRSVRPGPTISPVFALARPATLPASLPAPVPPAFVTVHGGHLNPDESALTTASIDFGEGTTQILCAAKLARWLDRKHTAKTPGWLVSRVDRLRAARFAGWSYELMELIPPGADRLPPDSVLTADGADFLRGHEWLGTRAWIEKKHQEHARNATRRFNF